MNKKSGFFLSGMGAALMFLMISAMPGSAGLSPTVSFIPATSQVVTGNEFSIDFAASGLDLGASAYQLTIGFDPSILNFDKFTPASDLGEIGFEYADVSDIANGDVTLYVTSSSNVLPSDILSLQGDGLSAVYADLGNIFFTSLKAGTTELSFLNPDDSYLGNASGDPYVSASLDLTSKASITSVPEPSTIMLSLSGLLSLLGLGVYRRKWN